MTTTPPCISHMLEKRYNPQNYYKDVELSTHCSSCNSRHKNHQVAQVTVGSSKGTTFLTKI